MKTASTIVNAQKIADSLPSTTCFIQPYAPHPGDISYPDKDRHQQHRLSFPIDIEQHPDRSLIALIGLLDRHREITDLNLNAYYCQQPELSVLPSLAPLQNLRLLNLEQNALTNWGDIPLLKQLEVLGLKNNQLSSIPNNIHTLTKLRELSLGHNPITVLPDSLTRLAKLRRLLLVGNPISTLPKNMSGLRSLEELEMSSGSFRPLPFSHVPNSLFSLPKLRCCTIHHAQLTTLPTSISQARSLMELSITQTQIKAIPSLHSLPLRILVLSENQLQRFDASGLSELIELDLCENQLTALQGLDDLSVIQKIDLSGNRLNSLPSMRTLSKLRSLNIAYNPIQQLPDLRGLSSLEEVLISNDMSPNIVRKSISSKVRVRTVHY
ncbi:MAG: leucine-rich repeat domain-containing protein [Myxococcota bacterium]|nr:leucine-rich repeat domain-containing protein [Myxococcota bacterium]